MGSAAARAGIVLALLVGACKSAPGPCRDDTVQLALDFQGATRDADQLRVHVVVGDGGFDQDVKRKAGLPDGNVELRFAPGALTGKKVAVTVEALGGDVVLGAGTGTTNVPGRCATLPIIVSPGTFDLALPTGDAAVPLDLAGPVDLAQADLTMLPDMAMPLPAAKGYWAFDEAAGTTATDGSGNGLTGTIVNATRIAGKVGAGALQFNGVDTSVDLGTPVSLTISGAMTIGAWIYVDSFATSGRILAKGGGPGMRGWQMNLEPTGVVAFMVAIDTNTTVRVETLANAVQVGQYYHLTGVYQPSTALRIYVNGVLNNSNTTGIPATQFNAALPVYIGRRADGTFFSGRIDEVRIYDVAFDAAQAFALSR